MKHITLGKTGIEVSELCFGTLPFGPLQKNIDVDTASEVIAYALHKGVNYIDTAAMYGTYDHIRLALQKTGYRPVISSKSTAADYDGMIRDVRAAIDALGVDYVDIFFLHAARVGVNVFSERAGALKALIECKEKGMIKAIGISTHDVRVTSLAARQNDIDIVFPIINMLGRGVLGGTLNEMVSSIEECHAANKGIVLMKALGGGTLVGDYIKAMDYCSRISKGRAAISLGMLSNDEVDMNMMYFSSQDISELAGALKASDKRFIVVKLLCVKCGKCEEGCHSGAISQINGEVVIDSELCITCGYCVKACKEFAIRMV